jgi:isoleucyl-tRNA synthetase
VDDKGRKMSKRLGNQVVPQKVINVLGADILRLWVAATDYSGEMTVSDEILKRISDSYRRIRNTARFLLGNLHGFDPENNAIPADKLVDMDRWAVERAARLQQSITAAYDRYDFHTIYQELHNFCVVDMGGFYLDIIKDRLYTTGADSYPRRSAQTAMMHIAEGLARWVSPILSFTGEEIWHELPGDHDASVLFSTWYEFPDTGELALDWDRLIEIRNTVSKALEDLRASGTIGSSLDARVKIYADEELREALEQLGDELRFIFITSEASVHSLEDKPADDAASDIGMAVAVSATDSAKCIRCWHCRDDVGSVAGHPEICGRCVDNVDGSGERRVFA